MVGRMGLPGARVALLPLEAGKHATDARGMRR